MSPASRVGLCFFFFCSSTPSKGVDLFPSQRKPTKPPKRIDGLDHSRVAVPVSESGKGRTRATNEQRSMYRLVLAISSVLEVTVVDGKVGVTLQTERTE